MRLKGILSSHARHAEHKARLERDAPQPQQSPHSPQQLEDGNAKCCGQVYAKRALAVHLAGGAVHEWCSGVGMMPEDMPPTVGEEMARARLYAQASRERQLVDGAEDSYPGW